MHQPFPEPLSLFPPLHSGGQLYVPTLGQVLNVGVGYPIFPIPPLSTFPRWKAVLFIPPPPFSHVVAAAYEGWNPWFLAQTSCFKCSRGVAPLHPLSSALDTLGVVVSLFPATMTLSQLAKEAGAHHAIDGGRSQNESFFD